MRAFPPVFSPIAPLAFARALGTFVGLRPAAWPLPFTGNAEAADRHTLLTDSGTSALSLALSHSAVRSVALPAYCCPDVGAASVAAGCRIFVYDLDPSTLAPDWDSLRRCLEAGARQIVVAHLLGRVVDLGPAFTLAGEFGALLIEDAAQGAGASRAGVPAGAMADVSILSFGRGKGANAGGGGALSVSRAAWLTQRNGVWPTIPVQGTAQALGVLARAAATQLLSNPFVYRWPAQHPGLGVGQTVYRAAAAPYAPSPAGRALMQHAWAMQGRLAEVRRSVEAWYYQALRERPDLLLQEPDPLTRSGALRFPIRVPAGRLEDLWRYGVVRYYPRTLLDYAELRPHIDNPHSRLPGAHELAATLHTLPTHSLLEQRDRLSLVSEVLRRSPR